MSADLEVLHRTTSPIDLAATLSPLRRGPGDPCHQVDRDGSIWRTSNMPSGGVTYRLSAAGRTTVRCLAWGPGAGDLHTSLGDLLGDGDDASTFTPEHPKVQDAHRRHPGLRIPRTGRVFEALVPAILEQKVTGLEAFRAWRVLVRQHGSPAPGPADPRMRVPPSPETWRMVPSWDFHRAGVDPRRSQTIVRVARVAAQIEACTSLTLELARSRLMSIPGVGEWTAAEVGHRALGDADALSVGDYHLSAVIGWSLLGRPIDDAEMVEYLAPWRPHRHRIVRLLEVSGQAVKPRFGPRMTVQDHRRH